MSNLATQKRDLIDGARTTNISVIVTQDVRHASLRTMEYIQSDAMRSLPDVMTPMESKMR